MTQADARIADIVNSGAIRLALFLPQFSVDPTSQEVKGHGTGLIAIELMRALARRLGIELQIVQCPTPSKAVENLKSDAADVGFAGIEPSRTAILDFTPAVFEFDYAFLVPQDSLLRSLADVDRPGTRIAIVGNHASSLALARLVKHAELIKSDIPDQAFALLCDGKVDVFALPRDVLIGYAAKLPGSRLLDEPFGFNRVGIAIRQGQPQRLAFLGDFVEEAKRSGLLAGIIEGNRATLPGFRIAAAEHA
jgi:polar amino acid transport system substrate-binding protein